MKLIASDSALNVEVIYTENKKERILSTAQLTCRNSYLKKSNLQNTYEIVTYLYFDLKVLNLYLSENGQIQKEKYSYLYTPELVSYPKPEKYNVDNPLLYDKLPVLRVRITENQTEGQNLMDIKKEKKISFDVLKISRV